LPFVGEVAPGDGAGAFGRRGRGRGWGDGGGEERTLGGFIFAGAGEEVYGCCAGVVVAPVLGGEFLVSSWGWMGLQRTTLEVPIIDVPRIVNDSARTAEVRLIAIVISMLSFGHFPLIGEFSLAPWRKNRYVSGVPLTEL
jgi:hypothetical protein